MEAVAAQEKVAVDLCSDATMRVLDDLEAGRQVTPERIDALVALEQRAVMWLALRSMLEGRQRQASGQGGAQ